MKVENYIFQGHINENYRRELSVYLSIYIYIYDIPLITLLFCRASNLPILKC